MMWAVFVPSEAKWETIAPRQQLPELELGEGNSDVSTKWLRVTFIVYCNDLVHYAPKATQVRKSETHVVWHC